MFPIIFCRLIIESGINGNTGSGGGTPVDVSINGNIGTGVNIGGQNDGTQKPGNSASPLMKKHASIGQ